MAATATRWVGGPSRTDDASMGRLDGSRAAVQQTIGARAMVLDRTARLGLAAVFLLLGYEWLLSGLNKLLSSDFSGGLADQLRQAMNGNPNQWYVRFLSDVVLPHIGLFAAVVTWGEIAVALGLGLGAAAWLGGDRFSARWAGRLLVASCGALAGSAAMTANYYLLAGNGVPWLNPGSPFNEGLDIDGLLTLVALALLGLQLVVLRASNRRAELVPAPIA